LFQGGQVDLKHLSEALPPLKSTADEVQAVAKIIKANPADIMLGRAASKATVKGTKLSDYEIVYFATHGLVSGETQMFVKTRAEPALALTIPEMPSDPDDNGLLTASEIALLKLNADWVVLSACNTAAEGRPGAEALSGRVRPDNDVMM
jgi:CHAT domain-containing protein